MQLSKEQLQALYKAYISTYLSCTVSEKPSREDFLDSYQQLSVEDACARSIAAAEADNNEVCGPQAFEDFVTTITDMLAGFSDPSVA